MPDSNAKAMRALLEIMAQLRDRESGCPWDLEQTFETIAPYTLEEAYEVDHAIRTQDMEALCDELGDLLLQVVFHAQMAEELGHFAFDDVARAICDKLIRRHPHIFEASRPGGGPEVPRTAEDQTRLWEEGKARERARRAQARGGAPDPFEGIPAALPALARAAKLRKRGARLARTEPANEPEPGSGFDLAHFDRALGALVEQSRGGEGQEGQQDSRAQQMLGQLLTRCVDAARSLGVDPEDALRAANFEYEARFGRVEAARARPGTAERS